MSSDRQDRRLVAILAADVAGYSRLVGEDEEGTLAHWKAHFSELIEPKIAEHHGRIVRITGDGLLVEFVSVVAALKCAVEVQHGMAERNSEVPQEKRIEFRIGINVGDIILDGTDMWGDGVNVAARLEALAEPGGICVSARVQEDVHGKFDISFEDTGVQQLKNIARPVRVYRVRLEGAAKTRPTLSLPRKPSLAVLPFNNMSGDPEQEYFADGMVEDLITALSRIRWLFVIARNSSFVYKGRPVDVKKIGRELGVHYVLEGGVRKAANRVRITTQLIDASTGVHLWADRFEGSLENIFDLQDEVTARVVGAIAPKVEQAEIERAKRKPTHSLEAYDYYLRGIASLYRRTKEASDEALQLLHSAVEIDPDFSSAYGMAAYCYVWRKTNGWMTDPIQETSEASWLAYKAVELGSDDAVALCRAGHALGYVVGDLDRGAALIDRALALNPNLATGWFASGWIRGYLGQPELAIEHLERAIRLSPVDMQTARMLSATAFAYFLAGRYNEASSWAQRALETRPSYPTAIRLVAASNALAGRLDVAREAIERLRQVDPTLRVSNLQDRIPPLRRPNDLVRYAEGMRKAGLPE